MLLFTNRMLPSIVGERCTREAVYIAEPIGLIKTSNYKSTTRFKPDKEISARDSILTRGHASTPAPTLPLIRREDSFTSLVSSRSTKSNLKGKRKKFPANKGCQEHNPGTGFPAVCGNFQDQQITTTELELDCEARNVERGLPVHVQNPRFLADGWPSAARTQFPQMTNVQMIQLNIPPNSVASQSTTKHPSQVVYLQGKWQARNAKNPKTAFVGMTEQATLNERYKVPLVRTATNHNLNKLQQNQARHSVNTNAPSSHQRCPCHHHRGDSSEETRKPQSIWERLAGTPGTSSDHLSRANTRLWSTTSPKRQPVTSKGLTINLRKKTKKVTSDSTSNILEKRKNNRGGTSTRSTNDIQRIQGTRKMEIPRSKGQRSKGEVQILFVNGHARNSQPDEVMEADEVRSERTGAGQVCHESVERLHEHLEIESVAGSVLSSSPHSLQRALTPRLLQVNPNQLRGSKNAAALTKEFQKLDSDCDGHLSFKELLKSLPKDLSKTKIAYLKKIYERACESTFFGLEEFMAAHQLCCFVGHASPAISDA